MKNILPHLFLLCFLVLTALPAAAQDASIQTSPEDMELIAVGTIDSIPRGDQIKMSDGKLYILDNIRTPVHMEASIRDYLEKNFIGKKVGIFVNPKFKDTRLDEKGNMLVHVMTEDAVWLQSTLVSKGLSWAYSTATNRDLVAPLYVREVAARKEKIGMWRDPDYAVRSDNNIQNATGSFQLYEGTVKNVVIKNDFTFINFGIDPTKDFTALIRGADRSSFDRLFKPEKLVNHVVRLRGWVEPSEGGPIIYITHQEQMEILGIDPRTQPKEKCVAGPGQFCPDQGPPPNHMKIR